MDITMTLGGATDTVQSLDWRRSEDGRRILTVVLPAGSNDGKTVVTHTLLAAFATKSVVAAAQVDVKSGGEASRLLSRVQCNNFVVRSARLDGFAGEQPLWTVTLDASTLAVTDFSDSGAAGRAVTL